MSPRPSAGAPILTGGNPDDGGSSPTGGRPRGSWIVAGVLGLSLIAIVATLRFVSPREDESITGPMVDVPRPRVDTIAPDESFGVFLARHQVDSIDVSLALGEVGVDPDEVLPGTAVTIFRGDSTSAVTAIAFEGDDDHRIQLTVENRLWKAHSTGIGWTSKPVLLTGSFGDSGWASLDSTSGAAIRSGSQATFAETMADLLAWQINVGRVGPGDRFQAVVMLEQSSDGRERIREIRAVRLTVSGRQLSAYRFSSTAGAPFGYFDDQGRALGREFLRAPLLSGGRFSSQYMTRVHPVLGTIRAHRGVDYPAPEGTPVFAAAAGVVRYAGPGSALGNFIELDHGNGVTTRYGHLSRISERSVAGYRVSRGQTIGYVGATGLATAAHLHYEFRVRGRSIDMRLLDVDQGRSIEPVFQSAFASERDRLDGQLGPITDRVRAGDAGPLPPPARPQGANR